MGAGKRARQRKAVEDPVQPGHRDGQPTVEVGPAGDEEPGEQERLVALAERIRKEAVRAYQHDS